MSFLDYSGEYSYENNEYKFLMKNGDKNYSLVDKNYIAIADPTIDNTFKQIFALNKNITKSFLNALLYPNKDKINKIEFLSIEHPGIGLYSTGAIRMDVVVKCYLNEEKYEKENNSYDEKDKNTLIVDIEMQIGYKETNDKKFLKYIRILDKNYISKKVMVLALIFKLNKHEKNISSEISYTKNFYSTNYPKSIKFDDCLIFQIDLNFCFKLICEKKNFYIKENQYIKEKGKEWIKFLTIPNWCKMLNDGYFILPPLKKININDTQLLSAFEILKNQGIAYEKSFVDQNIFFDELIDYNNKQEEIKKLKEKIKKLNEVNEELNLYIKKEIRKIRKIPKKKLKEDSDDSIEEDKSYKKKSFSKKKRRNGKKKK